MKDKILIIGLMLFLYCGVYAVDKVTFISDPWVPWVYNLEESPTQKGIAVEIIQEIFNRIDDYEAVFEIFPWKRCLQYVKIADKDGLILCSYNDERGAYSVYTDEVIRNKALIIYRKVDKPIWNNTKDLKKYSFGTLFGNTYGKEFDEAAAKYNYDVTNSPILATQAFKMLEAKRFDIFLTTETTFNSFLKLNPEKKDIYESEISPFSEGDTYYIVISKKSKYVGLLPIINEKIAELKNEGFIEQIMDKYSNY